MITSLLIHVLTGLVTGFLTLAPSFTVDFTGAASAGSILSKAGGLNGYVPVMTVAWCLVTVIGFKVVMTGYRLVLFVYHQVWGSD